MADPSKPFVVSAPGKVILFGEHAVVHAKPAIASAVALRTYLLVAPPRAGDVLELDFPDVGLEVTWHPKDLPWDAVAKSDGVPTTLDPKFVERLQPLVSKCKNTFQHAAALAFLYLYMSVCKPDTPPRRFYLKATLPIGAGLGSSASFSVALAAAFLLLSGDIASPDGNSAANETALDLINRWSFIGESCVHGTPSGIDNAVATRGGAVVYRRNQPLVPIHNFPQIRFLLVDTGISRRTLELVDGVRRRKDEFPAVMDPALDAIEAITLRAQQIFEDRAAGSASSLTHDEHVQLARLIQMNHGLLVTLGVSHPALENIKMECDRLSIGAAKLTGAGGGGCAVVLIPSDDDTAADKLRAALPGSMKVLDVCLGDHGVDVAYLDDDDILVKFASLHDGDYAKIGEYRHWS